MTNPYLIEGPALISFSGGRTSAYMLYQIIQAHGGILPENIVVAFANTGKEREETLRFVYECGVRWCVKIHWVEWRRGKPIYEEVGFNSASRKGEPFADLIAWKQRLPNSFERWCTEFLKVKIMFALVGDKLGVKPGEFTEVIGLRDDEGIRILRGLEAAEKHGRRVSYPLARARVRKPDIWKFWLGENKDPKRLTHALPQGFDLGLYPWEGNCTLCLQKGKGIRKRIIRETPSEAPWWIFQEVSQNGWFDKRDLVAELVAQVHANPSFFDVDDDMDYDVECGLHCPTMEAA
ncbi:3'-phosphoadenosine 5'-phosphosulfate sulfotransferase [Sinorhizobium medicae]|uniref:3'-phosphoadenosine 5'-phosphosulfate sulfotransferase n=1 Tax=Sinorhizobium medicae TaxID=110321 RepID=UPI00129774F8|nr:3'-phosphoadenosine 5'-phosphosulfate sulfotransferase [Sinorhizobium medicae]MQV97031.1 3'-phosphoadenosine 5'-phosphosulfate sulfotransferase [Sinorhizobium medicae]